MSLKKKNLTNELLRNYDNSRAKCVNFFLQKSFCLFSIRAAKSDRNVITQKMENDKSQSSPASDHLISIMR